MTAPRSADVARVNDLAKAESTAWAWGLRACGLAAGASLAVDQWQRAALGGGFIAFCVLGLVVATLNLPTVALRLVRLSVGGVTAVAGSILTLYTGYKMSNPDYVDAEGVSGALLLAVAAGAVGAWIADLRISRRAARAEAERHEQILAELKRDRRPLRRRG